MTNETWVFCPECGVGPGADHKRTCSRLIPPSVPAPDGWKPWPADMTTPHKQSGMNGKVHAFNAAGDVLPVGPDEGGGE